MATEIIARANAGSIPLNIQSATLGNGSILIDMAKLQLVQKLLRNQTLGPLMSRLSSKWIFKHSMKKLWSDKSKIDSNDLDSLWDMIQFKDGMNRASQVSQYLKERVKYKDRWIGALQQSDIPIHFVWGKDDPIAVLAMAEALHQLVPKSTLNTLSNVGHYPMLEAPKRWSSAVLTTLAGSKS
ncbi:MAG: alpha/beta hydrolase [Candidatus Marinimicrobia bacterium]|nr:alpha/beta hydrolase [Candidatus Neomarinimicrobiota bacterium]